MMCPVETRLSGCYQRSRERYKGCHVLKARGLKWVLLRALFSLGRKWRTGTPEFSFQGVGCNTRIKGHSRLVGATFSKQENIHVRPVSGSYKMTSAPARQNLKGLYRGLNWAQSHRPSTGLSTTLLSQGWRWKPKVRTDPAGCQITSVKFASLS